MKKYTNIPINWWKAKGPLLELSQKAGLFRLFIYLMTHADSGGTGLLSIDPGLVACTFGIHVEALEKELIELDKLCLIRMNYVGRCIDVWVVDQAANNFVRPVGPRVLSLIEDELLEHRSHSFTSLFLERYGSDLDLWKSPLLSRTFSQQHTSSDMSGQFPVNGIVNVNATEMICSDVKCSETAKVEAAWEYANKSEPVVWTVSKRTAIERALAEGYPVVTLEAACRGIWLDPWFVEHNKITLESAMKYPERFAALANKPDSREAQLKKSGWRMFDFGNGPKWSHKDLTRNEHVGIGIVERVLSGEKYFWWQKDPETAAKVFDSPPPEEPEKESVISVDKVKEQSPEHKFLVDAGWRYQAFNDRWVGSLSLRKYVTQEQALEMTKRTPEGMRLIHELAKQMEAEADATS